ncbi:MAG TPA: glycosyltransferase family A protein, partial [Solirubrobacteraceae bacterium]
MSFSIVVVLHDSAAHLRRLLASLDAHLAQRPQVICVDSGSRDDGAQVAREWGAQTLVLDGNPGFGTANNAGIALAAHPVSALLNPDCLALDDGLERLATLAAARRALVVPRLLNADGSVQRSAHPPPGGREAYLAALVPPRVLPRAARERLEPFRAGA